MLSFFNEIGKCTNIGFWFSRTQEIFFAIAKLAWVLKFGSRVLMKNYCSFCTFLAAFVWKLGHCSFLPRLYSRSLSEKRVAQRIFYFTWDIQRHCTLQPFETSVWLGMICTRSIKILYVLLRYSCGFKSALPKSWTTVCYMHHIWKKEIRRFLNVSE